MTLQSRENLFLGGKQAADPLLSSPQKSNCLNNKTTRKPSSPNPSCLIARVLHDPSFLFRKWLDPGRNDYQQRDKVNCSRGYSDYSSLQMPEVINTSLKYFPLPSQACAENKHRQYTLLEQISFFHDLCSFLMSNLLYMLA